MHDRDQVAVFVLEHRVDAAADKLPVEVAGDGSDRVRTRVYPAVDAWSAMDDDA
jgi:hypothetical protein